MRAVREVGLEMEYEGEVERDLEYAEGILCRLEESMQARPFYEDINPVSEDIIISWINDYDKLKNKIKFTRNVINHKGAKSAEAFKIVRSTLSFALLLEEKYGVR